MQQHRLIVAVPMNVMEGPLESGNRVVVVMNVREDVGFSNALVRAL